MLKRGVIRGVRNNEHWSKFLWQKTSLEIFLNVGVTWKDKPRSHWTWKFSMKVCFLLKFISLSTNYLFHYYTDVPVIWRCTVINCSQEQLVRLLLRATRYAAHYISCIANWATTGIREQWPMMTTNKQIWKHNAIWWHRRQKVAIQIDIHTSWTLVSAERCRLASNAADLTAPHWATSATLLNCIVFWTNEQTGDLLRANTQPTNDDRSENLKVPLNVKPAAIRPSVSFLGWSACVRMRETALGSVAQTEYVSTNAPMRYSLPCCCCCCFCSRRWEKGRRVADDKHTCCRQISFGAAIGDPGRPTPPATAHLSGHLLPDTLGSLPLCCSSSSAPPRTRWVSRRSEFDL